MNHANKMAGLISFHYFNTDTCKYKKMFRNGTANINLLQLQ